MLDILCVRRSETWDGLLPRGLVVFLTQKRLPLYRDKIMSDEDDYAEVVAEYIIMYLINQQAAGREYVFESEIWEMLGQPFPDDRHDQQFILADYTAVKMAENIVSISDYKKRTLN